MAQTPVDITPDALIERLMEVYAATSREDLARKLNVPTRTLQRWAAGKGMAFETAVDLLRQAGWLNEKADLSAARRERATRMAIRLADDLSELVETLRPG